MLVNYNHGCFSPQFQRKPNGAEMRRYTKSVSEGLDVLDKKLGIIVHNSTVPSMPNQNLGIGSLLSTSAALSFIPFLAVNAYSSIQQEPDNIRARYTPSPYSPVSTSKNIYMIPIERLATEEYGNLVPENDIQDLINKNSKMVNPNEVDYAIVATEYNKILSNAYETLMNEVDEHMQIGLPKSIYLKHLNLKSEFLDYVNQNREELTPKAVYEILSRKNNSEDWRTWNDKEKNLYVSDDKKPLNQFVKRNSREIEFYMFKQWLAEREISKANARNEKLGIRVIGDSPIAYTPVEEWKNQDLFMDGWALGCPPDYFSKDGQRWGFSVLKPETIFNPDGTLGKGGELMRERYEKMFASSTGGVRIDHIIGLIDPFVYSTNEPRMNEFNSGRLYSSPNHPVLGKYAKNTEKEYAAILEKIVFPAAAKYGLKKDDIICEDLGTLTKPVKDVMNHLGLTGIAVTQFDYRGKNVDSKNVIMPGSHDNESYIEYTDKIFENKAHLDKKTNYLAEDTKLSSEDKDTYKKSISSSKAKFMSASVAELFTSPAKKIQMFFTTFFGIGKTYNRPGTTNGCWTLRIPENYEDLYWNNVKKGTAPNLPESIARAIRQRGDEFANKHQSLLATLDEFTQILKS